MEEDIQEILQQAKKVSRLMKESEIFRRYQSTAYEVGKDKEASRFLQLLVDMGDRITHGDDDQVPLDRSAEPKVIEEGLKKHPLVMDYITAQREYLTLLDEVMKRIKKS